MGQVGDVMGAQGAHAAGVRGPAEHPGLEEGAIDDQLPAALEQVEQASLALGPLEFVRLLDGHPRHPPAFGGQCVTGAGQGLLLREELLARSLPLLLRHDRGCVHREMSFPVFLVALLACCHLISPVENLSLCLPVTPLIIRARRLARSEAILAHCELAQPPGQRKSWLGAATISLSDQKRSPRTERVPSRFWSTPSTTRPGEPTMSWRCFCRRSGEITAWDMPVSSSRVRKRSPLAVPGRWRTMTDPALRTPSPLRQWPRSAAATTPRRLSRGRTCASG